LAAKSKYDFRELGACLGNVGSFGFCRPAIRNCGVWNRGDQPDSATSRAGVRLTPASYHRGENRTSGLYHLICTPTIAFPVSSVGGRAPAMPAHRQALPTPRGDGKSDPEDSVARLPDVVAHHLWWIDTTTRRAPRRKPCNAVVGVQIR